MAHELPKPRMLANFKTGKKAKQRNWRKERPGMSEGHLALVRKLPCTVCLKLPAGTVHHLKSNTGERGMAVRSTDQWGVPMCMLHHEEVERAGTKQEVAYFQKANLDPHELAKALWRNTGDLAKMTRLVLDHRLFRVDGEDKKD